MVENSWTASLVQRLPVILAAALFGCSKEPNIYQVPQVSDETALSKIVCDDPCLAIYDSEGELVADNFWKEVQVPVLPGVYFVEVYRCASSGAILASRLNVFKVYAKPGAEYHVEFKDKRHYPNFICWEPNWISDERGERLSGAGLVEVRSFCQGSWPFVSCEDWKRW